MSGTFYRNAAPVSSPESPVKNPPAMADNSDMTPEWPLVLGLVLASPQADPDASRRLGTLAIQAALEERGFSPGLLDGIEGPKTALALGAFQASAGLPSTGIPDQATLDALRPVPAEAVIAYTITPEDEKLVGYCPPDWMERSRRARLLYPSLANLLAERFHTSERCLAFLNPGLDLSLLAAGDGIQAPRVRRREARRDAERIEIDLERRLVLILGAKEEVLGLLHCSVARDLSAAVRGDLSVSLVINDPEFTFDPKKWPEVKGIERKLQIPPGPRSPVGIRWIGLDSPGVGIHGTPEPENIGKTGSHGCFRLTNWDAAHLAALVFPGMRVRVVDRSPVAARLAGEGGATTDPPGAAAEPSPRTAFTR
jgi:hypothetical protein